MRLFYLLILLALCAISCTPATTAPTSPRQLLHSDGINLTLAPGHAPVETPLTLTLEAEGLTAVSGELTGVNMYMGRVPIRFSQLAANSWQAEFLLGACSEPDMQWQLVLQLQDQQGQNVTLKQTFQSSWR
ncbi:hypothetical protein MN202_10715 [Rheinheimera muenzenbergensis]|uniref:YtkA-like n=1 Tax=Rheinheimera muenzenbergensis TaxID=1193628 RepID=A0ABU8C827_9GAMM